MLLGIIACVLAVFVPVVVGIALLIYVRSALSLLEARLSASYSASAATLMTSLAPLSARVDSLAERVRAFETGLKETSAAHLARELAGLAEDVMALAKSTKKNFGRVWAEIHVDGTLKRNGERQQRVPDPAEPDDDVDDELAALLRSQQASTPQ